MSIQTTTRDAGADGKRFMRLHCSSLPEAARYIKDTKRVWRDNGSADPASNSWDLGVGLDGALDLAKNGWKDGAKLIATGLETLKTKQSKPNRKFGVYGTRPHPVRFAVGNPLCMIRKGKANRPKPALTVAVQIGAAGAQDARHMSNYGLALASYLERLSLAGWPIEVIAIDMYLYSQMRFCVTWTVKPMGAPFNYSDMAFSIGHPAAMRRISFALAERSKCPAYGGYGAAGNSIASDFEGRRNVIILNGMLTANQHSKTPEDALVHVSAAIHDAMKEQGLVG